MARAFSQKIDETTYDATMPCPVCGMTLDVGLLEITEDDGEVVKLFTFDCPTGEYHGILREAEVREMAVQEIVKRLQK